MSRYARRTDANHATVRDGLRARGYTVADLHALGNGVFDLAVGIPGDRSRSRRGVWVFVEVKDGSKSPSARRLTEDEGEFLTACEAANLPAIVVLSVEDAIKKLEAL